MVIRFSTREASITNTDSLPKRILIFADSQALPRGQTWGAIPYESTYPWLLQEILRKKFGAQSPIIMERGMRYRTIEDVLQEWEEEVELKKPNIVIVQVGASDCAPRVFSRKHREFWEQFPRARIRNTILGVERKHRRLIRFLFGSREYVSLQRFQEALSDLVRRALLCQLQRLILVNILPISDKLEFMCPGMKRNAEIYNAVFELFSKHSIISLVNINRLMDEWGGPDRMTFDSMHMKHEGQLKLAEVLSDEILNCLGKNVYPHWRSKSWRSKKK